MFLQHSPLADSGFALRIDSAVFVIPLACLTHQPVDCVVALETYLTRPCLLPVQMKLGRVAAQLVQEVVRQIECRGFLDCPGFCPVTIALAVELPAAQ